MNRATTKQDLPWWRHGMVWMVVAGPAIVVVASIATFWIAARSPDPIVAPDYYRRGIEINKALSARDKALLPAQEGRNNAVTPTRP